MSQGEKRLVVAYEVERTDLRKLNINEIVREIQIAAKIRSKKKLSSIFEILESNVRSYYHLFPTVFERATGYRIFDEKGKEYVDFFSGAGSLNYGHNNAKMKQKLIEYIEQDGITHSLDMASVAKRNFLERFNDLILIPRGFQYKVQFPGPTGTNSVEAALKLARKITGRQTVISFTNAFHGMTLGALSVTGCPQKRASAGIPLHHTILMPFDRYFDDERDSMTDLEAFLEDVKDDSNLPAAIILETIQAEGGINVASYEWLQRLELLARKYKILLIVDDIQVGCGRTGSFFSFEPFDIQPDIICLSKSISGFGLPMALVLIKPELDAWIPGEHNGTFRGNNLAFVTATEALSYWEDKTFQLQILSKSNLISRLLQEIVEKYPEAKGEVRGRGLIQGIAFKPDELARKVSKIAFQHGLIIEVCGSKDEVLKLIPPLIIDEVGLITGLNILQKSIDIALYQYQVCQTN